MDWSFDPPISQLSLTESLNSVLTIASCTLKPLYHVLEPSLTPPLVYDSSGVARKRGSKSIARAQPCAGKFQLHWPRISDTLLLELELALGLGGI
jgi:hypothetical protein